MGEAGLPLFSTQNRLSCGRPFHFQISVSCTQAARRCCCWMSWFRGAMILLSSPAGHQSSLCLSATKPRKGRQKSVKGVALRPLASLDLYLSLKVDSSLARGRRPGTGQASGRIISFFFLPFFPMTTRNGQIQNFTSNSGPQHPAAHGVSRSVLEMNGEVVERAEPHIGSLQCGTKPLMPRPCRNPCP